MARIISVANRYKLRRNDDTGIFHIFETKYNGKSACSKMSNSMTSTKEVLAIGEKEARFKAAEIGREVCGICVSHLYAREE